MHLVFQGILGLESKKACLLEEWDFKETTLPRSTQLTWFEGKPIMITMPQNVNSQSGKHKLYQGTALIFITMKEKHMRPLLGEAQAAELLDQPSEASMLPRRLRAFNFNKKFKPDCRVKACPRRFARFILDGAQGANLHSGHMQGYKFVIQ